MVWSDARIHLVLARMEGEALINANGSSRLPTYFVNKDLLPAEDEENCRIDNIKQAEGIFNKKHVVSMNIVADLFSLLHCLRGDISEQD